VRLKATAGSVAVAGFFLAACLAVHAAAVRGDDGAQLSAPDATLSQSSALRWRPAKVFALAPTTAPLLEPVRPVTVLRDLVTAGPAAGDRLPPPSTRGPPRG
jgi:hypothetical protein